MAQHDNADTTSATYDPKSKPALAHARPPWHSLAFIAASVTICIHKCRSNIEKIDEVAVLETWTRRVFPSLLSLQAMGWIRICVALSIWITLAETVTSEGWVQTTNYKPGSKLQSNVKIVMKGRRTLFPFTSWSWILLGISYTSHGILALAVSHWGETYVLEKLHQMSPWILRIILFVWQTAAPSAFLVSTVIRYAIWDVVKKLGPGKTDGLKHPRNMMSHNMNSVFVLLEVALLGGLPVRTSEMYLGPLYGSAYVCIAWCLTSFWAAKEFGPHFLYFFLDTTRGFASTLALMVLTTTLCLFYVLLAGAKVGLDHMTRYFESEDSPGLIALHVAFVLGIASLIIRYRD